MALQVVALRFTLSTLGGKDAGDVGFRRPLKGVVVDVARALHKLLVVLIFALDLLVHESGFLWRQVIDTVNFLLRVVVQMVLDQLLCRHRVDSQRLVAVEGEESESEQVEKLATIVAAQVQVLRDVEEEHKVVLVLRRKNDRANVLDLIKSGQFVNTSTRHFESVQVVRRLNVNPVFLLRVPS